MNTSRKIAVVGTGVIGASWVTHFLAYGFKVVASDPSEGAEARLRELVDSNWTTVQTMGLAEGASKENLSFTANLAEAVKGAEFIQENGPERLEAKQKILVAIESAADASAIIASSTSGLAISDIQAHAKHPERIVLGHPFNPPHLIPLVEVGGGKLTSPENVAKAIQFYAAIGKKPIQINKEVPGHIANRLQIALWREALSLVERGIASVEDIDIAISYGPGLRWALLGPFINMHLSGGPGGINHTLHHLGPAQREWANNLGSFPETDDYIEPVTRGVEEELKGYDFSEMVRQRDALLVQLLACKKAQSQIP